tara:strand:+ start:10004 stop:10186 length:183 start_codon:yes stop_codon:yes gene_type:complete
MVLNFRQLNGLLFLPILLWQNNIGPRELNFIKSIIKRKSGEPIIMNTIENSTSRKDLKII